MSNNMGKEALVVEREILFKDGEFQGFLPFGERDLISLITENHFYHARGNDLECNRFLKQIIPYVWIVNSLTKKVFLYKRFDREKSAGEYKENRYLDKYSGGVGGHIDKETEEGVDNPINAAMMRELKEEVIMDNYPKPKLLGFLNDDSDSLGEVHLGIVAIAETTEEVGGRPSEGLASTGFYSIGEVDEILLNSGNKVEGWTRISWPFVKGYLEKI